MSVFSTVVFVFVLGYLHEIIEVSFDSVFSAFLREFCTDLDICINASQGILGVTFWKVSSAMSHRDLPWIWTSVFWSGCSPLWHGSADDTDEDDHDYALMVSCGLQWHCSLLE